MQLEHTPSWPRLVTPISAPQGHSSSGTAKRAQAPVARANVQGCVQNSILCIFLKVISFQGGKVGTQQGLEFRSVNQNMQLGEDISWKLYQCYENSVVLEKCLFPL